MRYSAFEQAAAEATIGVREVEAQLEQLKTQVEQLKSKRDLLEMLSRQLMSLRPTAAEANSPDNVREMAPPAEMPAVEPAPASHGASDTEADMAAAGVYTPPRSLRESGSGWFTRNSSDSGIRGRL